MTNEPASRGRPDLSFAFDHDASSPRRARRALDPLLNDDDDPIAADVEVVVSELVSNVVQHTSDGGTVEAWDPKPDVPFRIEVSDTDHASHAPHSANDEGGRGLRIVDHLADTWGVEQNSKGTTVWAEFDRNTRLKARHVAAPRPVQRSIKVVGSSRRRPSVNPDPRDVG